MITSISPRNLEIVPVPETGQTVTGYGDALPTRFQVFFDGSWRAVKAICWSNCASFYIKNAHGGREFINSTALDEAAARKEK